MARLHYRDGRMEEVAMQDGLDSYHVAKFPPPSLSPWDIDPRESLAVERVIFKAADYGYETEVSQYVIQHPDLMDAVLSTAKDQGVPEYADFREPERDLFRGSYILVARWLEYFECRPELPRGKRARMKARRKVCLKERRHFLAWIKKVKRTCREMDMSWHKAIQWLTRDPVDKVGSWHSRWEGD